MKSFGHIPLIEAYKNKREPEAVHLLADAYWHALLIISALGAVALIGFSAWEFYDTDRTLSLETPSAPAEEEKLPFEKKDLQAVVDGFATRQAMYDLYTAQAPTISDPSEIKKTNPTR